MKGLRNIFEDARNHGFINDIKNMDAKYFSDYAEKKYGNFVYYLSYEQSELLEKVSDRFDELDDLDEIDNKEKRESGYEKALWLLDHDDEVDFEYEEELN